MTPRNRTRTQWLLVALLAFHLLATSIVYLATGGLPDALFAFSLVTYAIVLAAGIWLFVSAPRTLTRMELAPAPEVEDDPRLATAEDEGRVVVIEPTTPSPDARFEGDAPSSA